MKTSKRKIKSKAEKIQNLIMELHDDVMNSDDSNVRDIYRGYIHSTEYATVERYKEFSSRI